MVGKLNNLWDHLHHRNEDKISLYYLSFQVAFIGLSNNEF